MAWQFLCPVDMYGGVFLMEMVMGCRQSTVGHVMVSYESSLMVMMESRN